MSNYNITFYMFQQFLCYKNSYIFWYFLLDSVVTNEKEQEQYNEHG